MDDQRVAPLRAAGCGRKDPGRAVRKAVENKQSALRAARRGDRGK